MEKGTNISHYQILEKLGEGGMGVVYKARDNNLDRNVALKFLPPGSTPKEKDKLRFRQEARAAAQLNHPNICGIHAINEYEGQLFIEMEYVEGKTLRQVMEEAGSLSLKKVRKYALGIAEALSAAHREKIIHRDIKPENIMVDKNGGIKVMDFGLAKLKGVPHYTKSGSTVGTVTYMSPEQMQSKEIDARSDIFSFGVVLYEMLSGIHPFQAEYEQALMFKILNEDPEPLSTIRDDIPADLEHIVVRCLNKDRENRYGSANDIRLELQGKEKEPLQKKAPSVSSRKSSPLIPGVKLLSRQNVTWLVSAGLLILLLGYLWYYPSTLGLDSTESIPDEKHIVVLPFKNHSPQDISQSISDGIMEILTSKITQMETYKGALSVVPSTEVRADSIESVKEAGARYRVNLAVTGSLQHVGNELLLTINLIDVKNMRQIRSEVLEMDWANHNDLMDNVILGLTRMLDLSMENNTMRTLASTGTQSSSVYQLYIEGTGYLSRFQNEESIDKAIDAFREITSRDTNYVRAHAALAEAYWRKYELTRSSEWSKMALETGQEAIDRMEETVPEAYTTMAMIYNGMGRNEEALKILDSLEGPESMSYQALAERAEANKQLGNAEQAEEFYKKAIQRKNRYWSAYNNLGKFYYDQGRYEDALEAHQKVTEIAPENIWGHNNLGGAYYKLGMIEKAINSFKNSLEVQPNPTALTNLGIIYYYQERYSEAIRMYEKAQKLRDTDFRYWGPLGLAYHRAGADSSKVNEYLGKAIELAQQELEVSPNSPEVISQLAGYHAVLGNDEKCRELLQQLTSIEDPDDDTRVSIIHLYEHLGNREAALQWTEKSLKEGYGLDMLPSIYGIESLLNDPEMKKLMEKHEPKNQNTNQH